MRILHFADAHIDMAASGRHNPQTGLPLRVEDYLKSLDTIVNAAIQQQVDLVLFAGDAYKDRTPAPTFQREWGYRMMRLSRAGIPTLLLVGNHDLSPAAGRAHALQEYETLEVPFVRAIGKPAFLTPNDLWGKPLQVIAIPWVSRSGLMANVDLPTQPVSEVYAEMEARLSALLQIWLEGVDPSLPVVLAAHASVQGAVYGGERTVMLGGDLVLPGAMLRDPRLAYVALGHIHKAQDLNDGHQPPIIYPGSIERVDFGEANDDKFYVIADIAAGQPTRVEWFRLDGRRFIDRKLTITSPDDIPGQCIAALPPQEQLKDAIVRLVIDYPKALEPFLDEPGLRSYVKDLAFEFHLIRRAQIENRLRLPSNEALSSLAPVDLLDLYWKSIKLDDQETVELQKLAAQVIASASLEIESDDQS